MGELKQQLLPTPCWLLALYLTQISLDAANYVLKGEYPCNRVMYSLWGAYFFLLLLLPGLGLRLGWRESLRIWVSQQDRPSKWFRVCLSYPALILMDQAAVWDIYFLQVYLPQLTTFQPQQA